MFPGGPYSSFKSDHNVYQITENRTVIITQFNKTKKQTQPSSLWLQIFILSISLCPNPIFFIYFLHLPISVHNLPLDGDTTSSARGSTTEMSSDSGDSQLRVWDSAESADKVDKAGNYYGNTAKIGRKPRLPI